LLSLSIKTLFSPSTKTPMEKCKFYNLSFRFVEHAPVDSE
jgi:hypothetical protein